MELTDEILIAILAATDAVFVPDRDPRDFRRHTVIYERRRDYPNAGVPWASKKVLPDLDEAGRKRAQRALEELVAAGLVEARRPKGAKTHGVKLTDTGGGAGAGAVRAAALRGHAGAGGATLPVRR